MIEGLTDYLIKRRRKKDRLRVINNGSKQDEFTKIINTIKHNKYMLQIHEDGVYLRLAGHEENGESFSDEYYKIKSF